MVRKWIHGLGKKVLWALVCSVVGLTLGMSGFAQAQDLPEVKWRLQCAYPPPDELFPGIPGAFGQAKMLADAVAKATGGRFKIEVFPAGALFQTPEIFSGVSTGAIEMAYAAPLYWGGRMPEAAVQFGLPGFMVSYAQAKKMLWDTDWLKILRRNYEKQKVYLLGDTEVAQYNFILKFPLNQISDLKGKKIRASGVYAKALALCGAAPVKIEPPEQYIALERGTIDGTIFPAYSGITYKLFEVAKYATWPGLTAPVIVSMIANLDAYNKLPQAYRDALNQETRKWSSWCLDVRGPKADQYVRENGPKDYKAVMMDLKPETLSDFIKLTQPIWDEYKAKSEDCALLIELLKKAKDY